MCTYTSIIKEKSINKFRKPRMQSYILKASHLFFTDLYKAKILDTKTQYPLTSKFTSGKKDAVPPLQGHLTEGPLDTAGIPFHSLSLPNISDLER